MTAECFALKVLVPGFLCATSVSSVSLWCVCSEFINHRDTEDTEKSAIETFCAKPRRSKQPMRLTPIE